MAGDLPGHAEIVVVGGGVVGCSTAYHLARLGKRDVLLLERASLTSGATWHSAAMVRQLRSPTSLTRLTRVQRAPVRLVRGGDQPVHRLDALGQPQRRQQPRCLTHIRRQASLARAHDIEVHEVGPDEIARLWPIARTDDLLGGILSPGDGGVSPIDLCSALVRGARAGGVRVVEDSPVSGFRIERGRVTGVRPAMPIPGDHDRHVYIRDEAAGSWWAASSTTPAPSTRGACRPTGPPASSSRTGSTSSRSCGDRSTASPRSRRPRPGSC